MPTVGTARPTALGASCTVAATQPTAYSLAISEFVELSDGRRLRLHSERGVTISDVLGTDESRAPTRDEVVEAVLAAVLPDGEDVSEPHPYEWLAELAQQRGLRVSADELRQLPYRVEFAEDVLARWG